MSQAICCAEQARIDSPEPPPRVLSTINGIFAAAALPEDHPHTIKFAGAKKPTLDVSIIRSPNIASKLKSQFGRKSMRALLGKEEDYDRDAVPMSSKEVVTSIGVVADCPLCGEQSEKTCGSLGTLESSQQPDQQGSAEQTEVGPSVLRSLECLKPMLGNKSVPSFLHPPQARAYVRFRPCELSTPISTQSAACPAADKTDEVDAISAKNEKPMASVTLPYSNSTPYLFSNNQLRVSALRRTHSFQDPGSDQLDPKIRLNERKVHKRASFALSSPSQLEPRHAHDQCADIDGTAEQSETHLHTMDISAQLRSMSQLSDPTNRTETVSLLSRRQPWNLHHRERCEVGGMSSRSRHSRKQSSADIDSIKTTLSRCRFKSPAVSSVYSRPSSAYETSQHEQAEDLLLAHHETRNHLNAVCVDWPLKPAKNVQVGEELQKHATSAATKEKLAFPSTPVSEDRPGTESDATASMANDGQVKWTSFSKKRGSMPSKSSSSTLTKQSKASRFLERLSPPKKTVRKRRSIFRFLRPGSRRQQPRSISTPILRTTATQSAGLFDGPSDDPRLLSVHYELPEYPSQREMQSASMNDLATQRKDVESLSDYPSLLQRRPTLADYERNLTATGDDRRKPSSINLDQLNEVQEDDHRHSVSSKRKLYLAGPLHEDTSGLMAQALCKHQEEKAVFRSASKHKESLGPDRLIENVASVGTKIGYAPCPSEVRPPQGEVKDLLERLNQASIQSEKAKTPNEGLLAPPAGSFVGCSKRIASKASLGSASRRVSSHLTATQRPPINKIGTSLASWSRYPSHTRAERCGSAGCSDHVITRDFAVAVNPAEIHESDEMTNAPGSKRNTPSKRSGSPLPRSRSSMFVDLLRYYGNLFTTGGSTAQNRRTSVATSGWLQNPDLEMLPPVTSGEPRFQHRDHHFKEHLHQLESRLEEHVKCGLEQIEAEATKVTHHRNFSHHQGSVKSASSSERTPFRHGSIFVQSSQQSRPEQESTFVGPNDEFEEEYSPLNPAQQSTFNVIAPYDPGNPAERNVTLDGAANSTTKHSVSSLSKADKWSEYYKECLLRRHSPDCTANQENGPLFGNSAVDSWVIDSSALKPTKLRDPEQPKYLDPKATIRRFPSVTVVDDRKGHSRSVSLISVKLDRPGGIIRSTTNELLQLIDEKAGAGNC